MDNVPSIHKPSSTDESGLWGLAAVHVLGRAAERGLCGVKLPKAPPNPVQALWGAPAERRKALVALSRALRALPREFLGQAKVCRGCATNIARMAAKAAKKAGAK